MFSVEYCNASAEAMVSNPVKALNFFLAFVMMISSSRDLLGGNLLTLVSFRLT